MIFLSDFFRTKFATTGTAQAEKTPADPHRYDAHSDAKESVKEPQDGLPPGVLRTDSGYNHDDGRRD